MKNDFLEVLVEISEKMNSMFEIHNLLPAIINIAKEYLDVKRISLMLIEDDVLKMYAHAGFDVEYSDVSLRLGEGIAGKVAKTGVEVMVNHTEGTCKEMGYEASSFMSVPLKKSDKVLGVLNLTDKEGDYFNETDVKVARYIASQCALGVERFNIYRDMRKSENLRVVGMLNSSIAHDIKNLLNIVQSYLELMDMEEGLNPEMREYIDAIHSEVKRIHGLTLDLLDFSRQRVTINIETFRISELFTEIAKHANIMTKDTDIVVEVTALDDLTMKVDRGKIFRVIFNLVSNAIDALGCSGKVRLTAEQDSDFCVFRVRDTGKGVPKEHLAKLFQPFFSSGKHKGTGLGLAIVQMIVEAHNGTIEVDSAEGLYTEFTVRIPYNYESFKELHK
ncbi:GAF sensor signal transduction histidine kinase [Denitrovibrio acetiphilus DSM 12809]|uniref:histidine kinase n=1 Tax=Denitrovibrio acetiphilus (strain DSM 12809 / NBRC 114555 / N2460) TaxID=522772 RepID=D4H6B6_DENA2|nr:GAF domain-containing sensor histidine kinase [Denitrovibrio acetiphilus]ADD69590.1 GAF sensor signal transduction histidine kinase [Denitrovibrio acetiphilus DSM 12809]